MAEQTSPDCHSGATHPPRHRSAMWRLSSIQSYQPLCVNLGSEKSWFRLKKKSIKPYATSSIAGVAIAYPTESYHFSFPAKSGCEREIPVFRSSCPVDLSAPAGL